MKTFSIRYISIFSEKKQELKKIQISDLMKDIIQKMKVNFMQSIPGFVNLISFPGKYEQAAVKCPYTRYMSGRQTELR